MALRHAQRPSRACFVAASVGLLSSAALVMAPGVMDEASAVSLQGMRAKADAPACRAASAWLRVRVSGIPGRASRVDITVRQESTGQVVGQALRVVPRPGAVNLRVPLARAALVDCQVPRGDALEARVVVRAARPIGRAVTAKVVGAPLRPDNDAPATVKDESPDEVALPDPASDPPASEDPGTPDAGPLPEPGADPAPAPGRLAGTTRTVFGAVGAPVVEASGLAWSRTQDDVLWTHNDSGDTARVFAVGWDGTTRAIVPLAGVSATDIEDIAIGTTAGGVDALFIADIGDNAAVRSGVRVYRVAEPSVWGVPAGSTLATVAPQVIRLSYPDGARDAEAVVADRTTGDLYVVSKREARSRVYRASAAQVAAGSGVMHLLGEMAYGGVVGADACADGTTVVVKTYDAVRVHQSVGGIGAALLAPGDDRPYVREPQGEAIAVDASCTAYATLSEGAGQPIVRYAP